MLAAVSVLALVQTRGAVPSLDEVRALARAGKFGHAQAILDRYLERDPKNERAHLLMAQLTTEATNAQPEIALAHLDAIRPGSAREAAILQFLKGKAHYQERRYDLAEECWTEALRLDVHVPEAGWVLVDLLDLEGRTEEAHRLGMRLHEIEQDPRDRVKILLEMSRLDIETPDPLSQVPLFEPLVKARPDHLPLTRVLGLAMIRASRADEGLQVLEEALKHHPISAEAWDAWLTGLLQASETDRLVREFVRIPKSLASDPRFAKHEGKIAQLRRDWPAAARAYGRAFAYEPFNWGVCYQLRFVLRQAGDTEEYERIHQIYEAYKSAYREMRGALQEGFEPKDISAPAAPEPARRPGVYYEVLAIKTLGQKPYPRLYQRLAELRERMGRRDEAIAWHKLVLRDLPNDPLSLAALERLK